MPWEDTPMRRSDCGHLLCELIGGTCSLSAGVSRGCRTGLPPRAEIEPEVYDEVGALLAVLDPVRPGAPVPAPVRDAAVRLAAIIRREARDGRSVLAQARSAELDLVPGLARLCVRARAGPAPST
jgi:hypothetical protein